MIDIRTETAAEYDAIDNIHTQAFGQEAEAGLVRALRAEKAFEPYMSLVAFCEGEASGHILFSDLVLQDEKVKAAALAPMAVLPSWQRKGIGSSLIERGIEAMKSHGYDIIVVLGDPDYYERFGFRRAAGEKIRCAYSCPYLMAMDLSGSVLDRVDGIDVSYPEAFSALEE